jgi:hypothetical protein
MPLACRLCIIERGLRLEDMHILPQTREGLIEHFVREHPEVLDCEKCARQNAPWSRANWEQSHAAVA